MTEIPDFTRQRARRALQAARAEPRALSEEGRLTDLSSGLGMTRDQVRSLMDGGYDPEGESAMDGILRGSRALQRYAALNRDTANAVMQDPKGFLSVDAALRDMGVERSWAGDLGNATAAGFQQFRATTGHLAVALGTVSPEDAVADIARFNAEHQRLKGRQSYETALYFQDLDRSSAGTVLFKSLFSTRAPIFIAEQAANSLNALALGAAGAATAGPVGLAVGTGAGTVATEFGAWVNTRIAEYGYDITDPEDLLDAYRNTKLMGQIQSEAVRKGLGTGAVEALVAFVGGKAFKASKAGVAGGVVTETAGEVLGEAGGSFAATGEVDWHDAMLEGGAGMGQSVGTVTSQYLMARARNAVKSASKNRAATRLARAWADSDVGKMVPEHLREFVARQVAEQNPETRSAFIDIDDFNEFYNEVGEAPGEALQRIMGLPALAQMAAESGVVEIPLAVWAEEAASSAETDRMIGMARYSADGLSLNEMRELAGVADDLELKNSVHEELTRLYQEKPSAEASDSDTSGDRGSAAPKGATDDGGAGPDRTEAEAPDGGFVLAPGDEDRVLVEIDPEALGAAIAGSESEVTRETQLNDRMGRFERFLAGDPEPVPGKPQTARKGDEPIRAPTIGLTDGGAVMIEDGRHRVAVLREQGKPIFAAVPKGDVAAMREMGLIPQEDVPVQTQLVDSGFGEASATRMAEFFDRTMEVMSANSGMSAREFLKRYRTKFGRASAAAMGSQSLAHPAFHGTPHRFERFSLHAIGTGEGAQAFGWGLYFTDSEAVAEGYRERLSPARTEDGPMGLASRVMEAADGDADAAVAELETRLRRAREAGGDGLAAFEGRAQEAIEIIRSGGGRPGAVYEVELAPAESEYLLWDAPMSEQSEGVRAALRAIGEESDTPLPEKIGPPSDYETGSIEWGFSKLHEKFGGVGRFYRGADNEVVVAVTQRTNSVDISVIEDSNGTRGSGSDVPLGDDARLELEIREALGVETGAQLYHRLTEAEGSHEAASRALAAAGIPGIKYLDGNSRADGEGSYNYVIFDDRLVEITAVDGVPVESGTITVDGVERPTLNSDGNPIHPTEEGVRAFWRWFGDSKVVDEQGRPLVVYHGTTHQFDTFDTKRGHTDNHMGIAHYFTTDVDDAGLNYGDEGPDITQRVELLKEELVYEEGFDDEADLDRRARELLLGGGSRVLPTYLKVGRLLSLDTHGHGDTALESNEDIESIEDLRPQAEELVREREGDDIDISDYEAEVLDAMRDIADENDYEIGFAGTLEDLRAAHEAVKHGFEETKQIEEFWADVMQGGFEKAGDFFYGLRDAATYVEDGEGNLATGQYLNELARAAGYDGIAVNADQEFGRGRRGGGMDHLEGVTHYVVFEPEQIKSAIGNRGTFDPRSPRILESRDPDGDVRGYVDINKLSDDRFEFDVSFTGTKNRATFFHEMGHVYLEIIRDLATSGNEFYQGEWSKVSEWLGIGEDGEIARDQHEKWAEAFEEYILQGRPPTEGLRAMMAAFRAWLVRIYKGGHVQDLPDDVRSVMDRIVATDQEIALAAHEVGAPSLQAEALEGLSDGELAEYTQAVEAAREEAQQNALKKSFRAAARARADAKGEAMEDARRRAREFITESAAAEAYRALQDSDISFDPDSLSDAARRRLEPLGVVGGKDSAEVVARDLGYPSADEMARAMEGLGDINALVEQRARRLVKEETPELLGTAGIRQIARKAMTMEARATVLAEEQKILQNRLQRELAKSTQREVEAGAQAAQARRDRQGRRTVGQRLESVASIKARVRDELGQIPVGDVRPHTFLSQMKRDSDASAKAVRAGNWDNAARFKRRERINLEFYREALRIREQADKQTKGFRRWGKKSYQERVTRGIGAEGRHQLLRILDSLGVNRQGPPVPNDAKPLAEWLIEQEAKGYPIAVPSWLTQPGVSVQIDQLTTGQLDGAFQAAQAIYKLGQNADKLMREDRKLSRKAVLEELRASIIEHATPRKDRPLGEENAFDRFVDRVDGGLALLTKASAVAKILDGDQPGGAFWSAIIRPINEAVARRDVRQREAVQEITDLYEKHYGKSLKGMSVREDFAGASLSHNDRLSVLMHMGNAQGRQRLAQILTAEQAKAVMESFTDTDVAWAQELAEIFEGYFAEAVKMHERISGQTPVPVPKIPFEITTREGNAVEMPGSYMPIAYKDAAGNWRGAEDVAPGKGDDSGPASAYIDMGFLKERVDEYDGHLVLDHSVIERHVMQITHMIEMREAVIDTQSLLAGLNKPVSNAMGSKTFRSLEAWLRDTAKDSGVPVRDEMDKMAARLKNGVSTAFLGYNIKSAAKQLFGLSQSVVEVGGPALLKGIAHVMANPVAAVTKIHELSPTMRERAQGSFNRDLRDMRRGFAGKKMSAAQEFAFWALTKTQMIIDASTWYAQASKSMERLGLEATDASVVAEADQAVLNSQGSGRVSDIAQVERKGSIAKLLTTFYTDGSAKLNQTRVRWASTKAGRTSWPRFMADMFMLYWLEGIVSLAVLELMDGDDLEDDEGLTAVNAAKRAAGAMLNTLPFAREASGLLDGYPYRGPPALAAVTQVARAAPQINKMFDEDEEVDPLQAFKSINLAGGLLFVYPAKFLNNVADSVVQVRDGDLPTALVGVRPDR